MIFTKRENKLNFEPHPTNIGNQLIISSTATYQFSDLYSKVEDYKEKLKQGNDKYDIISYDYRDGLDSGLFEEEVVLEEYKDADPLTRKMEYLNIFVSGSGGFIDLQLLHEKAIDHTENFNEKTGEYKPPETTLEFEQPLDSQGNPVDKYALIFDDADTQDNFAYAVIKMDGSTKRLVQIRALKKAPIQEKIRVLREVLRKFNIVFIAGDQRHQNITDNLAEEYYYPDGEYGEPILIEDNEEQLEFVKSQYGNDVEYSPIIRIQNFSGANNELRAKHFLGEIEKGRFKIPAEVGLESKKEVEYYKEVKKTINEITKIVPKPSGKYVKYEPKSKSAKKDRWTVCELGCYMCDQYLKEDVSKEEEVFIGKWRG